MARITTISPSPASRAWRGRCGWRLPSTHARRARCHRPRVSAAADPVWAENIMPVYTVHAPVANSMDFRATDRFAFVRDGFHVWAAVLGVAWLAWHRLWLPLLGWIVVMTVVDLAMVKLGVPAATVFLVDALLALLLGFEAASLKRWTLS